MANDTPRTGRTAINDNLKSAAANLAGPAVQLASGAGVFRTAADTLKGAALDKLLGPTAVFAGSLFGVLATIRKIVRESQILEKGLANIGRLQQIEGKFTTLLRSAELAKRRIQELYQFAANSPFKFDDVAEANRILESLTKGAFSGAAAMKLVGDAAANTGQTISGMAERVGKLYSALSSGRSIDKIAFQLQFTGLATEGLLGKLENLEAAGVGFAEKWNEVTKVLAVNENGMKNEMKSLDALQTKLGEASALMATAFAEPFVDAQTKSIEVMTKATQNLTPVLRAVGNDLAAISGLVTNFKTGAVENTLATSGMAAAMRSAWEIGKGLFVTLSALTAIRGVMGAGKALDFFGTAIGAAKGSLAGSMGSPAGTAAKASGAAATAALTAGNLGLAASEGLVAAQFQVSARYAAVKAAAMQAAAGSTGLAAVSNGALAATSVVAAGATSLLARAAVAAGSAIKGAFVAAFANPLGIVVTSIYALVTGYKALAGASQEAADALKSVQTASADLKRELDRTEAAFQTTDDWAANMNRVTDEIAKAEQAAAKFKQTMADRGWFKKGIDSVSSFFGFGTGDAQAKTGRSLDRNVSDLRARRVDSFKYLPTLGMGDKESEGFVRDLRNAKDAGDAAFQQRLSVADDRAAVSLMDEEIAKLEEMTAATLKVRDAQEKFNRSRSKIEADNALLGAVRSREVAEQAAREGGVTSEPGQTLAARRAELAAQRAKLRASQPDLTAPMSEARADAAVSKFNSAQSQIDPLDVQIALLDKVLSATAKVTSAEQALAQTRRSSESELIRNTQRIADLRKNQSGSQAAREEIQALEKKNLALLESVRIVDDEAKRAQQLRFERTQRSNAARVSATALAYDKEIARVRSRGGETGALESVKELAVLREQLRIAREKGDAGRLEAEQIVAQIALKKADQAGFRNDAGIERGINNALINRNPGAAKALENAAELQRMRDQYKANGLTAAQADSDFQARIQARANPRIVADSIQSIGGGGGSAGAGIQYQRVTAEMTAKAVGYLATIAAKNETGMK